MTQRSLKAFIFIGPCTPEETTLKGYKFKKDDKALEMYRTHKNENVKIFCVNCGTIGSIIFIVFIFICKEVPLTLPP